jgi:hypothetical protein
MQKKKTDEDKKTKNENVFPFKREAKYATESSEKLI